MSATTRCAAEAVISSSTGLRRDVGGACGAKLCNRSRATRRLAGLAEYWAAGIVATRGRDGNRPGLDEGRLASEAGDSRGAEQITGDISRTEAEGRSDPTTRSHQFAAIKLPSNDKGV